MKTLLSIIILALGLTGLPADSARSAESVSTDAGVSIKANSLGHNLSDDIITASGDVFIVWEGMTLMAIKADYNRKTHVISATGNVVLIKDGDIVRGSRLTFDTNSGRGELENSTIFIRKGSIRLAGDKILKTGENEYSAENGSYTTCDAENPSWKIGASSLNLVADEYGTGKHAVFYIKSVPVFYFPYIIFPGKRERQTGFLFPQFGWSKTKGVEADLFYYWAISPSQDATVDLDIQSKRGVGAGLDYRYLRSGNSSGNLGGYLIHDQNTRSFRGVLSQSHREIFSPEMNLRSSINMTTDRSFLSDYGEKSGDYNRQSSDSTVNFHKTWQNVALTSSARFTQDYYAATNRNTLQTLPEIGLATVRQQLFSAPVYFDLDSRATNYYREEGTRGQRAYAFPRLTLVSGLPGYLHASLYAGAHMRAYNTDNIPAASPVRGNNGSLLPEAGARVSTSISRVYDTDGGTLKKLRHEIKPELSYTYAMNQDQSRFPQYDYFDRIPYQNIIYYSLTSLLGGKFRSGDTTEYRDLMRLRIMQGYSISGTRRDLLTLVDTDRPLTDLMLESETWIHPQARLTFDARYSVYDSTLTSATPGIEFDDKRGSSAGISYHMAKNEVEYLEARMSTKILRPWTFSYSTRYSFDKRDFLESVYSAEYRHQCWSIMAAYRDRPDSNASRSFTVNFSLMGTFDRDPSPGGLLAR